MIILEIPQAPDRPSPYESNIDLTGGTYDAPNTGITLSEKVVLELSDNADDGTIRVEDGTRGESITVAAGGGIYQTVETYDFDDDVQITPSGFSQGTYNVFRGSVYEVYEALLQTYIANRDADNRGYNGIRKIVGTSEDNGEIDSDPIFFRAENYIVGVLPEAALANGGRTYPGRPQVINALQFLYASYIKTFGGSIAASSTATRGPVSSETQRLGQVSKTTSYATGGSTASVTTIGAKDSAEALEEQALAILRGLGANVTDTDFEPVTVLLTPSAVEDC